MTEISTWVRDRVSADVDLDREGMVRLACEIVGVEELWRPYAQHDAETRFYRQLYRDPNLDVWLICWVDGQNTGYHDHDRSSGAVCIMASRRKSARRSGSSNGIGALITIQEYHAVEVRIGPIGPIGLIRPIPQPSADPP